MRLSATNSASAFYVALTILDSRVADLRRVEQPGSVPDPVCVKVADRLEDRFGAVILAGMNGLSQERLVGHLVGHLVNLGRKALLLACQVDPHDEQSLASQPRGGPRDLPAGHRVDLVGRRFREDFEEPLVRPREARPEEAHRTQDDPGREGRLLSGRHHIASIESVGRSPQTSIDRRDDLAYVEILRDVELWRETDLQISHTFGLAVLGQLECRALQCLSIRKDGDRVLKPAEILGEIRVALAEHQLAHTLLGVGGELDLLSLREFDQGAQAQASVEVDVEIGLRKAANRGKVHGALSTESGISHEAP